MTNTSRRPGMDLTGIWTKVESPPCADGYPATITFTAGVYRGRRGEGQGFVRWDAGIHRVDEHGRLVIGTATDELVAYEMRLEGDLLSLVDPDGCRFAYRRGAPPG